MKKDNKNKVIIGLILFGIAMMSFTAQTIYKYFYYNDGIAVEGIVSQKERCRLNRRTRSCATIVATVNNVKVTEEFYLPKSGLSINGIHVSSSRIAKGDTIELLAVPKGETYSIAIAEDIANLWQELLWELFILALIGFSLKKVYKGV